jgi:Beta-propeller repeat
MAPGVVQGPYPVTMGTLPNRTISGYDATLMRFEPNVGQAPSSVQYLARGTGYGVALTASGTILKLRQAETASLRVSLVGARANPTLRPERRQQSISNYFVGNDPAKWHRRVPNYAAVRYEQVYPGIDWVVYGNPQHLEYDFVVSPHTDPGQIGLSVAGADRIRVDANGDLVIKVGDTTLRQLKPVVYQTGGDGVRQSVDAHYILDRQHFAFALGAYDPRRPLIIDPELVYSTYLGGSQGYGGASAAAVDGAGDLYLAGSTTSTDFPLAAALQAANGDSPTTTAFVSKFNPSGTALLYSTYLGGNSTSSSWGGWATAIAVDAAGNAYLTGYTSAADFPTVNPYQAVNPAAATGGTNAFVVKIDPTGAALVYSTYLGGSDPAGCFALSTGSGIAIDGSGSAYVVGQTHSSNFPTVNAFQAITHLQETNGGSAPQVNSPGVACAGQITPVVTKLSPSGDTLVYSTYLGPTGNGNAATAVATDSSGSAYVVGVTASSGFPTVAAFQPASNAQGFPATGFVTKFSPAGTTLVYSTYLGGSNTDSPAGVAVDASGEAYVTGSTTSQDFPVVKPLQPQNNSTQPLTNGGMNAFITKFDASGDALVFSTYLGGSNNDRAGSIALDSDGNAYVAGSAYSQDFPTANALQTSNNGFAHGASNAFISVVNATGSTLEFSTYLGGSGSDGDNARGIAVDSTRNIYVAGDASSADFPTMAPFQSMKATTAPFVAFATKIGGALAGNTGAAGGGAGESETGGGGKGGGGTIGWDLIGLFAAALAVGSGRNRGVSEDRRTVLRR